MVGWVVISLLTSCVRAPSLGGFLAPNPLGLLIIMLTTRRNEEENNDTIVTEPIDEEFGLSPNSANGEEKKGRSNQLVCNPSLDITMMKSMMMMILTITIIIISIITIIMVMIIKMRMMMVMLIMK